MSVCFRYSLRYERRFRGWPHYRHHARHGLRMRRADNLETTEQRESVRSHEDDVRRRRRGRGL